MYSLYGVVVHHGSLHGGHYTAYVKAAGTRGSTAMWYYASDSHVRLARVEEIGKCNTYMLFYENTLTYIWLTKCVLCWVMYIYSIYMIFRCIFIVVWYVVFKWHHDFYIITVYWWYTKVSVLVSITRVVYCHTYTVSLLWK